MKFSIFHSIYILLLSASLSVMEVKGQGTGFTVPTSCNSGNPAATDADYYSGQTVYQLLCEVDTGNDGMEDPAPMFTRFCGLVNQYANLKNLLNTTSSRVTVLAPVDAAFSKVNLQGFTTIQAQRVLDLHVFPTIRSLEDLVCGNTYLTANPSSRPQQQRSKTKCDGFAGVGGQFQIGPCNTGGGGNLPRLGSTTGNQVPYTFRADLNDANPTGGWSPNERKYAPDFNANAVVCNGIIHTVNSLLLPAGSPGCQPARPGPGPGPMPKKGKFAKQMKKKKKSNRYYDDNDYYYDMLPAPMGGFRDLEFMDDMEEGEEYYDDTEEEGEEDHEAMTEDENAAAATTERDERLDRRKRVLESLVEPNGDIQPMNQ